MTHDEIRELLGAYALYALSREERAEVEEHLRECASCRAEVRELETVHEQLGMLAEEREPPPALRTRLMSIVELERKQWLEEQAAQQETLAANQSQRETPASARVAPDMPPATPRPTFLDALRRWLQGSPRWALGSGTLALVVVLIAAVILVQRQSGNGSRTYACAPLLPTLNGTKLSEAGCTVTVHGDHTIEVAFNSLPALSASKAYELWALPATGNPVAIAGFTGGGSRSFSHSYNLDPSKYAKAAISVEQAPGNSVVPHGPVVFLLPLKG